MFMPQFEMQPLVPLLAVPGLPVLDVVLVQKVAVVPHYTLSFGQPVKMGKGNNEAMLAKGGASYETAAFT